MIAGLIAALRHACVDHPALTGAARAQFAMLRESVPWAAPTATPVPAVTPAVTRHLTAALALAPEDGSEADLARALAAAAPALTWRRSYDDYAGEPDIDAFRQRYAYCVVVGPNAILPCDTAYVGFTLQAPQTFYPSHVHKAVEVYRIVAGSADWQRGGGAWNRRRPGAIMLHEGGVRHAMRTDAEPQLALFAWVSDLGSEVVIVRD